MADDQIRYSDLIADDVVKGLEVLNQALKDIKDTMSGVKEEAATLGVTLRNVGTATREQQQSTSQNAAAVERLSKKVKDLTEEEARLEAVGKRYKKLTDDQIRSVDAFQQALRGSEEQLMSAVNSIDIETKSYNELNAMYNALKASLNSMSVAERENTAAGKAMTAQSARIYETMNELQKATGRYTLQVGKYRAAFDGLGYSFQQILREAPSALNLNQFFLAISNNVPMFIDQLKAFKDEQKEIKANLAQMTEGAKEYSEQLGKVMTVGQKLGKTLMSWQTLVLVGLLIIRNWEKIVNLFQKLFKKVEDGYNSLVRMRQVINEIDANVESSISKTVVELTELNNRLADVTQGSEEWKNITERINEIMGDNYDLAGKMPGQIQQITQAYIAQAEQLAKNKFVIDKIAENAENSFKRQQIIEAIVKNGDIESAAKRLGFEKGSDQYKALESVANTTMPLPSATDPSEKVWEVVDGKPRRVGYDKFMTEQLNMYLDEELGRLFSNKELEELWNKYYKPMKEKTDNGPSKEVKDQVDDLLTLQRQLEDAIIANIENEFEREEAAEVARHRRFVEDKQAELKLVGGDAERAAVINQQIEEDKNTHDRNMLDIDEKYRQEMIKRIEDQKKEEEKAAKEREKAEKERFALEEKEFKARQEIEKRKFELTKHSATEEKKFVMEQQMELLQWRIEHAEALGISTDLLDVMKQEYAQMKEMYDLGRYSTGRQNVKGNYTSISELLWPDLDNDQAAALNGVFDQAKEALNGWMEARKAAADQSKELADDEVSAAENALNREIELRNQGYASDVALKEKELADAKKRQKEAAEMQKKAEREALLVNSAMEASSMAVAIANLFKDFPLYAAIPLTGVLLGSFAAAKIQSLTAINSTKYREGGYMLLNGGSHESGHDVNLGIGPDGSNLRAEGGEFFAVINKRNSRKYGSEIPGIVNALNGGVFEDRYIKTSDAVGMLPRVMENGVGASADLSAVENGVGELVRQGERRWSVEGEYRVERYKNRVRRVRVS